MDSFQKARVSDSTTNIALAERGCNVGFFNRKQFFFETELEQQCIKITFGMDYR